MSSSAGNKGERIRINIELDEKLSAYFKELKSYHGINANNDMLRNMVTQLYKSMIKEKKELGMSK